MRLQHANGFHRQLTRQWIEDKPSAKQTPRWSILRDVLGWEGD